MSTGTARARFDAVCFDCDSTLSRIEGIDELAKRAGCEAEIAALTKAAMNGEVPLDAVYGKRLERVRPGRADLDWLAQRYVEEMVLARARRFSRSSVSASQRTSSAAASCSRSSRWRADSAFQPSASAPCL